MPTAPAADELDGRHRRREHNRESVLDALAALFREGHYQPSVAEIAERAGVSPRSLFRYFDDTDDLNRAVIEREQEAARPLLEPDVDPAAGTRAKVEGLVAARMRLFDAIAPAARAARVCAHRHGVVARQVEESRSFLRHQLERLFAAELEGEGAAVLPAVDALCSFETYDLLRAGQRLSRARTAAALTAALVALLEPATGDPACG